MQTKYLFLLASILFLVSAFTVISPIDYKISEDYAIKFSGNDAEGIFKTLTGTIDFDETNVENSIFSFAIDVKSINTGNGMKNRHAVEKNGLMLNYFQRLLSYQVLYPNRLMDIRLLVLCRFMV